MKAVATSLLAIDRSSRRMDTDGRLHIDRSHISKAAINPYYGKEIPRWQELGLEPDKIYQMFRDPVELERAAQSFERLPILKRHVDSPATSDAMPNDLIIGAIGSNVKFNPPYLDADLCFWDATAIACIETDTVRELSCGYRYKAAMEPGEFEGQPYDGRITEIEGNHLALVEVGRAGSDVLVADHNPFIAEVNDMKSTKLGKALMLALCALSPTLAKDSAWQPTVAEANKKNFKKDEVKTKLMAVDAALDPAKLDSILDAILDVEQDPKPVEPMIGGAGDESPAEKLRQLLTGKVDDELLQACMALIPAEAGADADMDDDAACDDADMVKKEDVAAAVDAMRKEMREANEAARDVRPVVGDVMGIDSAEGIYAFALDHMKVDHAGVKGAAALKALYKVAKSAADNVIVKPTIAADAAGAAEAFPHANRFSRA